MTLSHNRSGGYSRNMRKQLREQVDGDSEFLKEPTQILEWLNSLGPEKLGKLVMALRSRDKQQIVALTGLSEIQAADALKVWKEKAAHLPKGSPNSTRFANTSTDPFASLSRSVGVCHLLLVHRPHRARGRLGRRADGHHHLL